MPSLSPEVLARVRYLPIDAYGMEPNELRLYLVETCQLIERQELEKLSGNRGNRSPFLGHNLGTSIEIANETQSEQAIYQCS